MVTRGPPRPSIDRALIVDEALALLNETSLAGLTMRGLAERLGVRAASLYWHFPNKGALISAISARLFLQAIETTPEADSWQEWLRGLGRTVWDTLIERPDSGLLIMGAEMSEEQFAHNSAVIRGKLERFDLEPESAFRLHTGVQALIIGWVTFAHSPYVERLEAAVDIKRSAIETLDALIRGWEMPAA